MVIFEGYKDGMPTKEEFKEINKMFENPGVMPLREIPQTTDIITFEPYQVVYVDQWVPQLEDLVFKHVDKAIILPVSKYYGVEESTDLDYFILSPKRCYNRPEMRMHTTHYLNYFEKFYDVDRELVIIYNQLKWIMDFTKEYNKVNFINDLKRYIILNRSILKKLFLMQ
jgi:hypothetical protein